MSGKFRPDRKIGFQNTFYKKCINVIIEGIGPSVILRSILSNKSLQARIFFLNKFCISKPNFLVNLPLTYINECMSDVLILFDVSCKFQAFFL